MGLALLPTTHSQCLGFPLDDRHIVLAKKAMSRRS